MAYVCFEIQSILVIYLFCESTFQFCSIYFYSNFFQSIHYNNVYIQKK